MRGPRLLSSCVERKRGAVVAARPRLSLPIRDQRERLTDVRYGFLAASLDTISPAGMLPSTAEPMALADRTITKSICLCVPASSVRKGARFISPPALLETALTGAPALTSSGRRRRPGYAMEVRLSGSQPKEEGRRLSTPGRALQVVSPSNKRQCPQTLLFSKHGAWQYHC